jgi:hypothetical protein
MRYLKIAGCYLLAAVIFPFAWLGEQPGALRIAHLNTFAEAHAHAKAIFSQGSKG